MRSSTACLVSIDAINSNDNHASTQPDKGISSLHSKNASTLPNDTSKERMLLSGVLKSPKESSGNLANGSQIGYQASTTSPISPKCGSSGRRSGANLTVTFDFDYEDRSIGNDISDTPRSHVLKEVPSFLQNKVFGPVIEFVGTKRLGGASQQKTEKKDSSNQKKSNYKSRNGVDVIRKKPMAPQPPSLVAKTHPAV